MKADNEQLSALIDNEIINESLLDELITNEQQQETFSRYHLIGDAIRSGKDEQLFNIDISQQVMGRIMQDSGSAAADNVVPLVQASEPHPQSNIISFVKRFGQYAIAASVAGVVVVASLLNTPTVTQSNTPGIEVLNTVPFGGSVAPVSLQASPTLSKEVLQERNERLEALLKDHQLQLQTQP